MVFCLTYSFCLLRWRRSFPPKRWVSSKLTVRCCIPGDSTSDPTKSNFLLTHHSMLCNLSAENVGRYWETNILMSKTWRLPLLKCRARILSPPFPKPYARNSSAICYPIGQVHTAHALGTKYPYWLCTERLLTSVSIFVKGGWDSWIVWLRCLIWAAPALACVCMCVWSALKRTVENRGALWHSG
jgi:hypothetical protein